MKVDNVLDNVANFLLHPAKSYNNCNQVAAWIVTIFAGIATVGIIHGLSFLWLKLRVIPKQPKHEKIQNVFHEHHPIKPTLNKPLTQDESSVTTTPTQNSPVKTDPTPLPTTLPLPNTPKSNEKKPLNTNDPSVKKNLEEPKKPIPPNDQNPAKDKQATQSTTNVATQQEKDSTKENLDENKTTQPAEKSLEKDKPKTSKPVKEKPKLSWDELSAAVINLLPAVDTPCKLSCPEDWQLFKNILVAKSNDDHIYDLNSLGQFKVHFSNANILIDKLSSEGSYHSFLEIEFNQAGLFSKLVFKNPLTSQYADISPQQGLEILNICFRETLKLATDYKKSFAKFSGQLAITCPQRSASKIPEYHLMKIYDNLKYIKEQKPGFHLFVTFQTDSLSNQSGVDSGGLRKQYLEMLVKCIIHSPELKFFNHNERAMPHATNSPKEATLISSLTTKEENLFLQLGYLMGFFYTNYEDIKSGHYFNDFLFRAMQVFKDSDLQIPFSQLNMNEQLRLGKEILDARKDVVIGHHKPYECLQVAKLIEQLISNEKGGPLAEKKSIKHIKDNMENAGIQFLDMPDEYVEDGEIKYDAIDENKDDFLKELYLAIFNLDDSVFGKASSQIPAIHSIARGMKEYLLETRIYDRDNDDYTDTFYDWSAVQGITHYELEARIQGEFNRENIANSLEIKADDPSQILKDRTQWLRDWILDKTTTDNEVRMFLQYVTGQTVLGKNKIIEIHKSSNNDLLYVHTCFNRIDINSEPVGDKEFNAKEGFIQFFKNDLKSRNFNEAKRS